MKNMKSSGRMRAVTIILILGVILSAFIVMAAFTVFFLSNMISFCAVLYNYLFILIMLVVLGIILYVSYSFSKCPDCGSRDADYSNYLFKCRRCGKTWKPPVKRFVRM